jgi:hypothetical protein
MWLDEFRAMVAAVVNHATLGPLYLLSHSFRVVFRISDTPNIIDTREDVLTTVVVTPRSSAEIISGPAVDVVAVERISGVIVGERASALRTRRLGDK